MNSMRRQGDNTYRMRDDIIIYFVSLYLQLVIRSERGASQRHRTASNSNNNI